jgi:AraC-like DNA-binding protein
MEGVNYVARDGGGLIPTLLSTLEPPNRVEFIADSRQATDLAYCVNFPRLEFVLEGELQHWVAGSDGRPRALEQKPDTALFVLADAWNDPQWTAPVTTLSLLFSPRRLGFSVLRWNGREFEVLAKRAVDRRGPRTGTFILQAMTELVDRRADQATAGLLARALVTHSLDLLQHPPQAASRSTTLFYAIRRFIDDNYALPLTRESVSSALYISPDHLSHVFQKEARTSFNDYLAHVRLEHAKDLLKRYDMKVKEVAYSCGFNDSNYFCRLFRLKTQRSPSEYRAQYQSQQH